MVPMTSQNVKATSGMSSGCPESIVIPNAPSPAAVPIVSGEGVFTSVRIIGRPAANSSQTKHTSPTVPSSANTWRKLLCAFSC